VNRNSKLMIDERRWSAEFCFGCEKVERDQERSLTKEKKLLINEFELLIIEFVSFFITFVHIVSLAVFSFSNFEE
jgi:hypothetical protein